MSDETKQIEATAGPYKGQRITMPAADADQAIADGWAIDPFAPVDPDAVPKEQTEEERQKSLEALEKAMAKLRGEAEEGGQTIPKPGAKPVQRDLKPTDSPATGYTTRRTSTRDD